MPRKITATLPGGRKINLTVPDGATNDQIKAKLQSIPSAPSTPPAKRVEGLPGLFQQLTEPSDVTTQLEQPTGGMPNVASLGSRGADIIRNLFEQGGATTAETLAGPGLTAKQTSLPPPFNVFPAPAQPGESAIKTSPNVAAGIGGTIQIIPDIAELAAGGVGANIGRKAALKTLTTKGIGAEIGELEKAAGVVQKLPDTRQVAQAIGLPAKTNFSQVINKAEELIDAGEALPAQLLSDLKILGKKALNSQAFREGQPRAILTRAVKKIDEAFNSAIPGRTQAATRFGKAKRREELLKNILGGTGTALKRGAQAAAIGGIGGGSALGIAKLLGLGR